MTAESFFDAVKRGDREEVERMLSHDLGLLRSRTEKGISSVLLAIYHGKPEMADLLIERGAVLDIFDACAAGRLERARSLLEANPSLVKGFAADGFQALGLAAFFGHAELVRFLLAQGASVNTASQNAMHVQPLHSAVAGRHFEIARELLGHGADVNACQAGGYTPLHAAAQNGQLEMLQLLLENGADVLSKSYDGTSALDLALENGHLQAADLLRDST
jgi:ankyrin repeat protein